MEMAGCECDSPLVSLFLISRSGHAAAEARSTVAIAVDTHSLQRRVILAWRSRIARVCRSEVLPEPTPRRLWPFPNGLFPAIRGLRLLTVLIIAATGIISAQFHVSGPIALRSEDYGLVLLGKQGLVVLVIAAAALNLKILRPRLHYFMTENDVHEASTQLRGNSGGEWGRTWYRPFHTGGDGWIDADSPG